MCARRRAFALIVVLIAVGAVFALAMRSAVVARTTVIEATALGERASVERDARSAVAVVLRGLTAQDEEALREGVSGAFGAGGGDGGTADGGGEGSPELPAFIRELLGLEEVQEEADELVAQRNARLARAAASEGAGQSVGTRRTIELRGLPGRPVDVELGGKVYRVTLRDGASTLDANDTDGRELRAYFAALGLEDRRVRELADQWLDWIDEDQATRTYGAEQGAYTRDGVVVRDGAVGTLEELRVLPAMTGAVFDRVRRDWSVASSGVVHAGSASFAVLAALEGSDEELAQLIIETREEGGLTRTGLDALLPGLGGDALRERLTLRASGIVRAAVDVMEGERATLRFEGAAVVSSGGIELVELRAVE